MWTLKMTFTLIELSNYPISICIRSCKGNALRYKLKNKNTTKEYVDKE